MGNHILTDDQFSLFQQHLKLEEREQSTIEKYLRDLQLFAAWLAGRPVTAEIVADWKNCLRTEGYNTNLKLKTLILKRPRTQYHQWISGFTAV